MSQPTKKSRFARIFRRLVRCEAGGGDLLTGILMTGVGLLAVSQTIPPLREAFNTAGDALKRQAQVLARGSDTGAVNGFSSNGLPSGVSGFDFGSGGGAFAPGGNFAPGGGSGGSGGSGGGGNGTQIANGADSPDLVKP